MRDAARGLGGVPPDAVNRTRWEKRKPREEGRGCCKVKIIVREGGCQRIGERIERIAPQ